jgi:hypothetical protein
MVQGGEQSMSEEEGMREVIERLTGVEHSIKGNLGKKLK